ncbi:MAG: hypothetical protein V4623_07865 [Pseudomonadota bacterium]
MSEFTRGALSDYLSSLGMALEEGLGDRVTCQLENGWTLHFEHNDDALRVLIFVPREWDLDACIERALLRVNLLSNPRFSPMLGLYRDALLFALRIDQRRCTRAEISDSVNFLMRLGEMVIA